MSAFAGLPFPALLGGHGGWFVLTADNPDCARRLHRPNIARACILVSHQVNFPNMGSTFLEHGTISEHRKNITLTFPILGTFKMLGRTKESHSLC